MKRSRKIPARKTTKPAAKRASTTRRAAPATPPPARDPRLPAVGTTMTRTYKGAELKVRFLDVGVELDGKPFESLSAAARHATGAASINGFLWFGLTKRGPAPKSTVADATPAPRAKKPAEPKIGKGNELATAAGQRAALAAAGIAKASTGARS